MTNLTDAERSVIQDLLHLAGCSHDLLDNSEHRVAEEIIVVDEQDFEATSGALERLDLLPDDQPGYTMGPAAKARWALRRLGF
jgi:hypothetical protein